MVSCSLRIDEAFPPSVQPVLLRGHTLGNLASKTSRQLCNLVCKAVVTQCLFLMPNGNLRLLAKPALERQTLLGFTKTKLLIPSFAAIAALAAVCHASLNGVSRCDGRISASKNHRKKILVD